MTADKYDPHGALGIDRVGKDGWHDVQASRSRVVITASGKPAIQHSLGVEHSNVVH